jgi:hypothetical protein
MCPRGIAKFWRPKNHFFYGRYGLLNFLFLFLGELGTYVQNLISTNGVDHREKNDFPTRVHIKRLFFDNRKGI